MHGPLVPCELCEEQRHIVKKRVGNIEIEIHEATNDGEAILVYLSIRSSTIKCLNLLPDDARDLIFGLQWALGQPQQNIKSL